MLTQPSNTTWISHSYQCLAPGGHRFLAPRNFCKTQHPPSPNKSKKMATSYPANSHHAPAPAKLSKTGTKTPDSASEAKKRNEIVVQAVFCQHVTSRSLWRRTEPGGCNYGDWTRPSLPTKSNRAFSLITVKPPRTSNSVGWNNSAASQGVSKLN